jgi:septum formation protein
VSKEPTEKPQVWQALSENRDSASRVFLVLGPFQLYPRLSNPLLVLASSSAYRRALLERLRLPITIAAPGIDERPLPEEMPRATALRLAEAKARAVAPRYPDALIIGSDQVAVLDGQPLGKPGGYEAALQQLLAASGRTIVFHTAVCLLVAATGDCQLEEVPTSVQMRDYAPAQAGNYLERERPYDCAGSAKIEALGIALVERLESSDPTALIGLPLIALVTMLAHVGVQVL